MSESLIQYLVFHFVQPSSLPRRSQTDEDWSSLLSPEGLLSFPHAACLLPNSCNPEQGTLKLRTPNPACGVEAEGEDSNPEP